MGRRFKKSNKKGFSAAGGPTKRICLENKTGADLEGAAAGGVHVNGRKGVWTDWVLENAAFEKYYKAQKICPEDEFDVMLQSLRAPLPVAIRINKLAPAWQLTRRAVESRFGSQRPSAGLCNNKKESIDPAAGDAACTDVGNMLTTDTTGTSPATVPPVTSAATDVVPAEVSDDSFTVEAMKWFPDNLAWHWRSADRQKVKRNAAMKDLKQFLVDEDMRGAISRQEAVSMIPPLMLDLQPHHLVLDMCAAPGSKTTEMMDIMTWPQESSEPAVATQTGMPRGGIWSCTGVVVANDASAPRASMLTHQVQRLGAPHVAITCIDACFFPALLQKRVPVGCVPVEVPNMALSTDSEVVVRHQRSPRRQLLFDRILADVPCSGDATLRKSPDIWRSWSPQNALLGLHARQLTILTRGIAHLAVGGKLLYSTCSLNPIENEAVVAAVLKRYRHCLRLEACPNLGEHLITHHGLSSWLVPRLGDKTGTQFYEGPESVSKEELVKVKKTVFPPSDDDAADLHLERCLRLLPHSNDSGGFFVALITKFAHSKQIEELADEPSTPTTCPLTPTTADNDATATTTAATAATTTAATTATTTAATTIAATTIAATTIAASTDTLGSNANATSLTCSTANAESNTAVNASAAATSAATAIANSSAVIATAEHGGSAAAADATTQPDAAVSAAAQKRRRERNHDVASRVSHEYTFVDPSGADWADITQFYGLTGGMVTGSNTTTSEYSSASDLVHRTVHRVHTTRRLYVVSQRLSTLLKNYEFGCALNWMHMGVRAFEVLSASSGCADEMRYTCKWRIAQDGAAAIVPYMTRRLIIVSTEFVKLLGAGHSVQLQQLLDAEKAGEVHNLDSCRAEEVDADASAAVKPLVSGGAVMICLEAVGMSASTFWETKDPRDAPCIACLIGRNTVVPYISKIPFGSLCSLL